MIPRLNGTHLASLLDELWQRPTERAALAEQLVAHLNDVEGFILVAWDLAATFGPSSGRLNLEPPRTIQIMDSWGKLFLAASLTEANETSNQQYLIMYRGKDIGLIIHESSPNIPIARYVHDLKSLLIALQLIRDHLDSALFKPPELRNAQIVRFAASSGLEDDRFRRLASWFPTISVYL